RRRVRALIPTSRALRSEGPSELASGGASGGAIGRGLPPRRSHASLFFVRVRASIVFFLCLGFGCEKKRPASEASAPPAVDASPFVDPRGIPKPREDTRFVQIRTLLGQDPESPERSTKLYPLVEPICTQEKERADFVDVAKWSASFSHDKETLPTVLALDT